MTKMKSVLIRKSLTTQEVLELKIFNNMLLSHVQAFSQ